MKLSTELQADADEIMHRMRGYIDRQAEASNAVAAHQFADLRESLQAKFAFLNRSLAQSRRQARARLRRG